MNKEIMIRVCNAVFGFSSIFAFLIGIKLYTDGMTNGTTAAMVIISAIGCYTRRDIK